MTDLDLPNARLAIRRRTGRHFIYLDELTLACLDSWLRERHRRWPRTPNPHLLVSQQTAADTAPVAPRYITECFAPTETSPSRLRQDRILDEARSHCRPCAPHAAVRHLRHYGHEVRLHRAPRTPVGTRQVATGLAGGARPRRGGARLGSRQAARKQGLHVPLGRGRVHGKPEPLASPPGSLRLKAAGQAPRQEFGGS